MSRAARIVAWTLAVIIGVPVLLVVVALIVSNTNAGRHAIEQLTASYSNGRVQLQGLSGNFPNHLRLHALTIADAQGPWLRASEVSLDWAPVPLLFGELDVERITASQINVERRPNRTGTVASTAPPRSAASRLREMVRASLRLPLTVRVGALSVPRLQLAAALAGAPVALRLQGALRYRSLHSAALQVRVQRLDQVPATYYVEALLNGQRVRLNAQLAEQANGPLANLMQLPGLGALAASLHLQGPRDALAVQLDAHAGPLSARANGSVDLTGEAARLDMTLQSPAMTPRPGLSWQAVTLRMHANGAFTAPATDAQLQLTGLVAGTVRVQELQAQLQGEGQGLALQGQMVGLALPAPLGTLLQSAPIAVSGDATMTGPRGTRLDLSLRHPLIEAQAHYQLASLQLAPVSRQRASPGAPRNGASSASLVPGTGTLTARFPRLAPWAALAHAQLQGQGSVTADIDLRTAARAVTLTGVLGIDGGTPQLTTLLSPRTTLSAALTYEGSDVQLRRSQLTGPYWMASAQGSDRGGQLDVRWQVAMDTTSATPALRAAIAASARRGTPLRLNAQGRVQGSTPHLSLQASADTSGAYQSLPGAIRLTLQAQDLPSRPSGQLNVDGSLDHAPLQLQARLQQGDDGTLALEVPDGSWKSVRLQGALRTDGTLNTPGGELTLRVSRLGDLDPFIGEQLAGALQVELSMTRRAQRLHVSLSGLGLTLGTNQLSMLQVSGDINQPLRSPQLALMLTGTGQVGGSAAQLSASVSGPLQAMQLHATAQTTVEPHSTLAIDAVWRQNRRELQLTGLVAQYRQQTARLLAPARVSFRDGLTVQRLRLALPPATLEVQGRITPVLNLRASAHDLTSAIVAAVMPELRDLKLRGRADTNVVLRGSLRAPTGSVTLHASGLGSAAGEVRGLPQGSITAQVLLAGQSAQTDVAIDAGSKMRFRITGRVPLVMTQPVALRMDGDMDLDLANAVLEAGGQRLAGRLHAAAQLDGTLSHPQARGELTLSGVSAQDYARGLSLTDLNAHVMGDGSQVRLTQLSARAGSGTLAASGDVNLAAPGLPLQLTLTGRNAQPLKSDLITTNVNLDIKVTGELAHQDLQAAGLVRINNATINIPNGLPPDVAVLHVVKPGEAPPAAPAPARPLIARFDLTVNAPTGIFVKGRGVNAQVGGILHVSGSSSRPNISGGFDLIRGTLDMAGSTLTFNSGRISFNGTGLNHKIDPTLDFTASTYSAGVTATLHITGYADAPVINLSSMPPLPQDEILARLLFGESASQLTALQAAGIGAGLISLTGVGGGASSLNPITAIQHALGLNRLTISSGTPGGPQVNSPTGNQPTQNSSGATIQAGRYITNRVYVGAVQSTNGLTQAQVQVDLTRNLKLQTTLSTGGGTIQGAGATPQNDPGSSIGVRYQFQY
jgi:translocation and assembly module TamB